MKDKINDELMFLKNIINDEYTISNLSIDDEDANLFICEVDKNNYKCVISYLKGLDVYLFITDRYNENKVLSFEHEFWFEDYNDQNQRIKFNKVIADFTTDNFETLLDKRYACQIVYN